jgi:hypothetical protein
MLSPSFVNYNPSPGKRTKKKEITKSRMYGSITSRLQNLPQGTWGRALGHASPNRRASQGRSAALRATATAVDLDREAPHYFKF